MYRCPLKSMTKLSMLTRRFGCQVRQSPSEVTTPLIDKSYAWDTSMEQIKKILEKAGLEASQIKQLGKIRCSLDADEDSCRKKN